MRKMSYPQEVCNTLKKYDDNPELLEDKEGLAAFKEFLRKNLQIHTVLPDDPLDDEKCVFTWQADGYSVDIRGRVYGCASAQNLEEDNPKEYERVHQLLLSKGDDISTSGEKLHFWLGYKDEDGEITDPGVYWDDYTDFPENLHRLIEEAEADDIEISKDKHWEERI